MTVRGYKADEPSSYAKLSKRAAQLRTALAPGVGSLNKMPGVELFERLDEVPVTAAGRKYEIEIGVNGRLASDELGRTAFNRDQQCFELELSEETYTRLSVEDWGRARFSLYHEIAHLELHANLILRMGYIPHDAPGLLRGSRSGHKVFWDTEWQADGLAGFLLCPTEGLAQLKVQGRLNYLTISRVYGMSYEAAKIRAGLFRRRGW